MGMIQNDWLEAIGGEFRKPYYKELYEFVKNEYSSHVIYPPSEDIFNAFHFTPLSEVKVLLLDRFLKFIYSQILNASYGVNNLRSLRHK